MRTLSTLAAAVALSLLLASTPAAAKGPKKGKGESGQVKHKHHKHHGTCGHERKFHDGKWVYLVGADWFAPSGDAWIVIRF